MPPLAALPLPVAMLAAFVGGVFAGALVNWAVYGFAWHWRAVSPWSPPDESAPLRRAADRIPVWGWLGLRREESLHGRGFWVRPLAVELLMGAAWAALYWWEINRQGLIAEQFAALADRPLAAGMIVAPAWITLATFASHALLIMLLAAASLIDIDEKTIPDEITIPGTLLALVLAAVLPMSLLPQAAIRMAAPPAGVEVALPAAMDAGGGQLYVEPTTPVAPNEWPQSLRGAPHGFGLVIGLACYATWCLALTPRIWRGRRGMVFGLRVLLARVARELTRPPLVWIGLIGAAAIFAAWFYGGAAWVGLLTALVGMIGGGAMVWSVRIAASSALRVEALGFGDVTLMMMVGAFLGWQAGVIIFFLAPFAALVVGLLQLVTGRGGEIFFGPFLSLAAVALMLRWGSFWNADGPLPDVFSWPGMVVGVLALGVVLLWAILVVWRNVKELLFGTAKK